MANLEAQPKWSSVRLLEAHELARGGLNGNMNEQAKALAERTEFLNQEKASKYEIIQGVFEFGTYAEFDANKATLPANCTVVIGEENTTGSGQWDIGNNSWNGTVLKKSSFDPVEKSKEYADKKTKFWKAQDIQVKQFDSWSTYSVGFVGINGKMPLGIKKDGTVVSEKLESDSINTQSVTADNIIADEQSVAGMRMQYLDPFSGYVFGFGNGHKYPFAVKTDGTFVVDKLETNQIVVSKEDKTTSVYEKASQEWWIYPTHIYTDKPYPRVISSVYGEDGSIIVGEYVIGQGITKQFTVGKSSVIDDHDAPSVWHKEGRRAIVMWQHHDRTKYLLARTSTRDGDISTLEYAATQQISTGTNNVSYTQLHYSEAESTESDDIFYVFSRFAQMAWGFTKIAVNQITGIITTLDQHKILSASNQYYITSTFDENKIRIASYYNPSLPLNQIHYWEIDVGTGDMTDHTGAVVGNIISHNNLPVDISTVTPVLEHNAAIDRRLFYVRSLPMSPAILYLEWTAGQLQNTGSYKVTALENGSWVTRTYAPSGKPFFSTYFSGASFPDPCLKDEIVVCRYDNDTSQGVLERVINVDETMITIESERVDTNHLIRPIAVKDGGNLCSFVQLHAYGTTGTFSFESDVKFKFLK